MPVRFDCHSCRQPWWAPPGNGCPRCGYGTTATPDPVIWSVGRIPGTEIFLSAQLRDQARFLSFVGDGFAAFVDAAGDAPYVWRPGPDAVRDARVEDARIPVEDTNVDLPDDAFASVSEALGQARRKVLVFCAAGLKRSPHLLYGVLRARGHDAAAAWSMIATARPFAERFDPYIVSAERWAAGSVLTRGRFHSR